MIRFECDYTEGAHPRVLEKLVNANMEQTPGYGEDPYCEAARDTIQSLCHAPQAAVHFLVGGTQANATVIDAALRPYQGVLSADTGHINAHETGAIEATGHKVLALPGTDGKITAEQVQQAYSAHWADPSHEHTPQPGMVYISHPTEYGTLYSLDELQALSCACRNLEIPLFMDGARLGYALASPESDLSLPDIARLCDVFTIGGTKVGALFGEAVVITNSSLQTDFRYLIKQHGGMLAKGRLLGLQFSALLEDNLYLTIAAHADEQALKLRDALLDCGFSFLIASPTNQQFPILPNKLLNALSTKYTYSVQQKVDDEHTAIRLCTSWATLPENVDSLIADIRHLHDKHKQS